MMMMIVVVMTMTMTVMTMTIVTMLLVTGGWGERAKVVHICLNLPFQLLFHSPWSSFYANSQRKPQIGKQKYKETHLGGHNLQVLTICWNVLMDKSIAPLLYANMNSALYKYELCCMQI